jgi:hypothetical protein
MPAPARLAPRATTFFPRSSPFPGRLRPATQPRWMPRGAGAHGATWGTVRGGCSAAGSATRPGRRIVRDFTPRIYVDFEPEARAGRRRPDGGAA